MMSLGSGIGFRKQFVTIPPGSVGVSSLSQNAISILRHLGLIVDFFLLNIYFLLLDGESPRLVRYAEVGLVMKPRHLTSTGYICYPAISDTVFSQIFIFFQLTLIRLVDISPKKDH